MTSGSRNELSGVEFWLSLLGRKHPLGRNTRRAIFLVVLVVGFLAPFPTLDWGWVAITILFLWSPADLLAAVRRPFLFLYAGLCLLSVTWSHDPRTLEAALVLIAGIWLGLSLTRTDSAEELARLVAIGLIVTLSLHLASILVGLEGAFSPDGQWRGLSPHKNALGRWAGFGLLVALSLPGRVLAFRFRAWLGCMAALLLLGSRSLTPTIALLLCLAAIWLYKGLARPRLRLGLVLALLGAALWVSVNWAGLLHTLDRSPALSGRIKVWAACERYAAERPWFGYGYAHVEPDWFPNIVHPHNGILSLLVQVGLIGCSLFLLDAGRILLAAGRVSIRRPLEFASAGPLVYVLFFGLMNLAEVFPMHGGHFSEWILYVAASQMLLTRDSAQ